MAWTILTNGLWYLLVFGIVSVEKTNVCSISKTTSYQYGPVGQLRQFQRHVASSGVPPEPHWSCPHWESTNGNMCLLGHWLSSVLESISRSLTIRGQFYQYNREIAVYRVVLQNQPQKKLLLSSASAPPSKTFLFNKTPKHPHLQSKTHHSAWSPCCHGSARWRVRAG